MTIPSINGDDDDGQGSLFEQAKQRRDTGMERAERGAGSEWTDLADDVLRHWLRSHDTFFVDDFWQESGIERPDSPRALGPVVKRAAAAGLMVKSGAYRKSVASNLTEKPVWRSLIREGE